MGANTVLFVYSECSSKQETRFGHVKLDESRCVVSETWVREDRGNTGFSINTNASKIGRLIKFNLCV